MVQLDLLRDKVARMRDAAAWLRACLPTSAGEMTANRDVRDLVSFRVYLVIQESIEICSHLIADQGWGPVASLRDHFTFLADRGVLPVGLAGKLAAGVKVRNLIGHAYAVVDPPKMHEAAVALLALVDPFCQAILSFAEKHAT